MLRTNFTVYQVLNIYAFPRSKEYYEDSLICCIKENPEPVIFKVSCHGCRPELEVDKRALQFDKVLLHRSAWGPSGLLDIYN